LAFAYFTRVWFSTMTPLEIRLALKAALDEAGTNMAAAAKAIGRNPTYLQQFIKYGKPDYLEERDREGLATLYKVNVDGLKPPPPKLPDPIESPAGGACDRPRAGDAIKDAREATIVHTWRQVPKQEQDTVVAILNGILRARGLPPIAL
jgi:hypothetical protein